MFFYNPVRRLFMKNWRLYVLSWILVAATFTMSSCAQSVAAQAKQPVLETSNLVNGTISVKAASYNECIFSVTAAMKDVCLTGSFTASGGTDNDIIVQVLDDTSFVNWTNGHAVTPLYSTGQLRTSSVNVLITIPGTYHLVFSNKFSASATKQVAAQVDMNWYEQASEK
jgi:hypothetical protein